MRNFIKGFFSEVEVEGWLISLTQKTWSLSLPKPQNGAIYEIHMTEKSSNLESL